MARHGKKNKDDITETHGNPVLRLFKGKNDIDQSPERIKKDVEIVDKGWNNTVEGQEDLRTKGASRNKSTGKHKKTD